MKLKHRKRFITIPSFEIANRILLFSLKKLFLPLRKAPKTLCNTLYKSEAIKDNYT